jgi:hypothetical protein
VLSAKPTSGDDFTLPGDIAKLIFQAREASSEERNRLHLGASKIGAECERELFYSFRWALNPQFSGRMLYLFERGQSEEQVFLSKLRSIGIECFETEPHTDKQFHFSHFGGHFSGSLDGIACKIPGKPPEQWHVLEFKTHNNKSFTALINKGVQAHKPEHYAQMQIYMGMTGYNRALYGAVNKDNDELYFERVRFSQPFFEHLVSKAARVIFTTQPPDGISADIASTPCKYCDFKPLCYYQMAPQVNCRTCRYSAPLPKGGWDCANPAVPLTTIDESIQRVGCPQYERGF